MKIKRNDDVDKVRTNKKHTFEIERLRRGDSGG